MTTREQAAAVLPAGVLAYYDGESGEGQTAAEATALERAADALEPVLAALHPTQSPLVRVEHVPFEVTGHLLRAQRAMSGGGDGGALLDRISGLVLANFARANAA